MLHGALPRAFLAPGLKYLGGYYGEDVPSYSAATYIPLDGPYSRIGEHHVFPAWSSSRPTTPCPLDLSLKHPPTPSSPRSEETIEVDDEEDQRKREAAGRRSYDPRESEDDVDVEEELPPRSALSHPLDYDQLLLRKDHLGEERLLREDTEIHPQKDQKYKMVMSAPGHLRSMESYHQQLLLTPLHHLQDVHAPMTPPSTPSPPQCPRKRSRVEDASSPTTPTAEKPSPRPKKKHARRLKFDEDTSSPVSGTVILGPDEAVVTGDIDPAFNVVEVTEEARAELAKIENRLGPYQCRLCRHLHEDAFQLAQHRCSRIAHVEYRCPECDKRFSCPANLASHRRWHKPRLPPGETTEAEVACTRCDAKFTRQAALRKHTASQHPEANGLIGNSNVNLLSSTCVQLGVAPLGTELP